MKKKIIITISNNGQYDQRMHRIANSLSRDFDVLLLATTKKTSPLKIPHQNFTFKSVSKPFSSGILFYTWIVFRYFFYLLSIKTDVIYAVDLDTLVPCALVARLRSKKLIFDAHEYFSEVPELHNKPTKKKIWEAVANRFIPWSSVCFTVNQVLADKFTNLYGVHFHTLRNMPVSKQLDTFNKSSVHLEPKIILYQGVINQGRGIEQMLEAMKELTDYQLVLAGEGDLYSTLKNQNKLPNVSFLGYIKPSDLKAMTDQAWIGINLIESYSLNYYYSLANKFFDYVQSGIPSINMNYPVYAELNEAFEVSVLLDALTSASIIAAVHKLEKEDVYTTLQANCHKAAEVWNWENEESRLDIVKQQMNS